MASSPFIVVDAVSETKRDLLRSGEVSEADYKPFLANRSMSYHADAVLYANDMNLMPHLPALLQHDYYMGAVRPRRRRSPWYRPEVTEAEDAMGRLFGYSKTRAREAAGLLRDDELNKIVEASNERSE